jgi:hypothetical protein
MVQDSEGRWWAKHRETGEWNYFDGSTWVRGTPPGYEEVAPETVTDGPPAQPSATPHPEVERGENRWGRRPWLLVAGLAGLVALIAVVGSFAAGNAGGPETAEVPDVVGKPRSEAEKTLKSAGFEVQAEIRESAVEDADKVIRQSPSGGDVEKGSEVAITVGEGPPEENSPVESSGGSAPGYRLIQTPDGGLSAEVPPSWGVETGQDSEREAEPNTWSYHIGEYLLSSITTAPSIQVWYGGEEGSSGAYFVASRTLAQYSDYELTHSFLNAGKDEVCAEAGPYEDYDRPPLSGKLQTWYECGVDGATVHTLAAAPEGRGCVVALSARIQEEADREAIEHLVDTVEVDCGRVTSRPLATPSAPASSSASTGPKATGASPEASPTRTRGARSVVHERKNFSSLRKSECTPRSFA